MKLTSENKNIRFNFVEVEHGLACYVSGTGALVYSPEIEDTAQFLAIENHSPYWCRPFWGSSLSQLPAKVQALLIKKDDSYTYYLPICDSVFKTLIRGTSNGFEFCTYSNCNSVNECENQLAFIIVYGNEPLTLMKKGAKIAVELLGNGLKLREEKFIPDIFNYIGWCSWDSMQIRVNHQGLIEKTREFKEKSVPIRFAIIDDMWADVPDLNTIPEDVDFGRMVQLMHASKMRSFDADPKRFPNGIKAAIDDIKAEGIDKVGIWFPTTGYWAGLMPDGIEAQIQKNNTITLENGQIIVAPNEEKAQRYFDNLCARTKEWGADFVKIDNQGMHQRYENIAPIGESARAIQNGIDQAADKYFNGALINCMGMPSECMFNRSSALSRCSDDFIPESKEWFAKNILQCSYNGLLQGQFYVNDWDMWWTDDAQAVKNSLCRAISGGPIYISDKIGRTNPDIFKPLCLENGRIIRPDESATPTEDCLMQNPTKTQKIFKIRNRFGNKGVCAVFNINEKNDPVVGTLSPEEIGIPSGDYIWFEYFTKESGVLKEGEKINVSLKNNDVFRLYSFMPKTNENNEYTANTNLFMGVGL